MKQTARVLKKIGLSTNEITVYLEALKHDELTPYKLSKSTGIPRTTVYDILMNLSLKGLVELEQSDGFTKQQTLVRTKNPSTLRKILQKKRKNLIKLETDIVDILPFLKQDFHGSEPSADFQFHPGIKGFKHVYLNTPIKEIDIEEYTWDCLMPMDVLGPDTLNKLVTKIDSKKMTRKYKPKEIVSLNDWTKHVLAYQYSRDPKYLSARDIRYIDSPSFKLSVEMSIIGTQILISCAEEKEVWGLIINSNALSNTFKSIFYLQWLTAKELTPKIVESWGPSEMWEEHKKRQGKQKDQQLKRSFSKSPNS